MDDLLFKFELIQTCTACPEQYDVKLNGKQVGYLRLRHGNFTVECPDCGCTLVYQARPKGDGCFQEDEREHYITQAKKAILVWVLDNYK